MILCFVVAVVYKLIADTPIDDKLWIIVSAGVGYLFGAKPDIRLQGAGKAT